VIGRVAELVEKSGVPMAHISLAWMLRKNPVVAPVVGATKIPYLESAVAAEHVKLEMDDIAYLEEPYTPRAIVGLIPYGGSY
jgi:aryl-alcohol dehydrogenase-like predicted oxidoreductase